MQKLVPFFKCFSTSSASRNKTECRSGTIVEKFPVFSYNELKAATQQFRPSNNIGKGHIGSVYKGWLRDGSVVAVKVLSVEFESMRGEREFISEIAALCDIRHENLVGLRGCCVDGAKRLLVYDYMPNNSLAKTFLGEEKNRIKFRWKLRKEISIGVAKGLAYLHEEIKPHIVHRDIKPRNILLDENFKPKVGDFGLSKLFRDSNISHLSTGVAGTLGYIAPEYALSGHLTRKSDVYSFGVLLMEIVTGCRAIGFDLQFGEQFLVHKVWEMYKANNLLEMVDKVLEGDFPEEEALVFLKIGLLCVQETTRLRPNMSSVVKMLMNNEIDINGEEEISRPGVIANLKDVKLGHNNNNNVSSSAISPSNASSMSPQPR
ncbi:hypothetical protein M9H77_24627 [Catharanthus roseus]|uniref:Uncharacterized protein n=1 Tax=Catharanthus roseus TaxID=4058 RepID=A0ACC0AWP1_CATRO|nr:hypothetical protein M9H77_24627 [Catharanthus roseus]